MAIVRSPVRGFDVESYTADALASAFNGYQLLGGTLTSGTKIVPDYQGVLQSTPSGVLAAEGLRLSGGVWVNDDGAGSPIFTSQNVRTRNGVVPLITDPDYLGARIEGARTNYLLNSQAPATQTTGSLGTGTYTLWIEGTGSVSATDNTATSDAAGQSATEGSPLTFTISGAGTVDIAVTGDVTFFQLEGGSFPSSHIYTAGTTVTRPADVLSYPSTGRIRSQNCAVWGRVIPLSGGQDFPLFLWSSVTTPGAAEIRVLAGGASYFWFSMADAGGGALIQVTYNYVAGRPFDYRLLWSDQGMAVQTREYAGDVWSAWSAWSEDAHNDPAEVGETLEVGGRLGTGQFFGNYPFLLSGFLTNRASLADYETLVEDDQIIWQNAMGG